MILSASASHIEQVPLSVVDILKLGLVGYGFKSFLQGQYVIVTGHDRDSAELQAFRQVHRADRELPRRAFENLVQDKCGQTGLLSSPIALHWLGPKLA